jgi:hypothetical protein
MKPELVAVSTPVFAAASAVVTVALLAIAANFAPAAFGFAAVQ